MILKELILNYTEAFDTLKIFDPGSDEQVFNSLSQFYKLRHNMVLSFIVYTIERLIYNRDITWSKLFFLQESTISSFLDNEEYSYDSRYTPDVLMARTNSGLISILNLGMDKAAVELAQTINPPKREKKSLKLQSRVPVLQQIDQHFEVSSNLNSSSDSTGTSGVYQYDDNEMDNKKQKNKSKDKKDKKDKNQKKSENIIEEKQKKQQSKSSSEPSIDLNLTTSGSSEDLALMGNDKLIKQRRKERCRKTTKRRMNYYLCPTTEENKSLKLFILDISVSTTSNSEKDKKLTKYLGLNKRIRNQVGVEEHYNSEVVIFNLNPSLSNLEKSISELAINLGEPLLLDNFPIGQFRSLFNYGHQVYNSIKSTITDPAKLEKFFNFEFGHIKKEKNLFLTKEDIIKDVVTMKTIQNRQYITEQEKRCNDFNENYVDASEDELLPILKKLIDDDDIQQKYRETQTSKVKLDTALNKIQAKIQDDTTNRFKPSIHTFAPFTNEILMPFGEADTIFKKLEQKQIMRIMEQFVQMDYFLHEMDSLKCLLKCMLDIFSDTGYVAPNSSLFETGKLGLAEEDMLDEKFAEYTEKCKHNNAPAMSKFKYFKEVQNVINIPDDSQSRSYRQKMLKLNMSKLDDRAKDFISKNHTAYKKVRDKKEYSTSSVPLDSYYTVDDYLKKMSKPLNTVNIKNHDLDKILTTVSEYDESVLKNIKLKMMSDYMPIYNEVSNTHAFKMSYRQHLILKELNHISQFTLSPSTYTLFTAGCENVCFLVQNSYHNKGKDVGKAFLSFGYTDDIDELSDIYGEVKTHIFKHNGKTFYFFMSSWRRLTTTKTVFLMDQFYSTLSTGMNSLLRHKDEYFEVMTQEDKDNLIMHHYSLKVLVSLCSNQRTAELLSDFRYAIMSTFSEFSELHTFIEDKYQPPFRTAIDSWILNRISNISDFLENREYYRNQMRFKQPTFLGDKRKIDSIGGKFNMPSLWTGVEITDLQDLLDDMFLYVHTMKEPSSVHHENIKAINTILKFQKMYESTPTQHQKGEMKTFDDFKCFLMSSSIVGHSRDIVMNSCNHMKGNFSKMQLEKDMINIFNEPLSAISSTKAAVPEYERIKIPVNITKRKQANIINVINKNNKIVKPLSAVKTVVPSLSNLTGSLRAKVHDGLLDLMERGVASDTVFSLAKWNIIQNRSRVVSDICIKAQYGAKREFYVINLGAKAMARILEEVFHKMCNYIDNEMISVPGDRKLLKMQEKINNFMKDKRENEQIFFTNGDCTKWSAAETMECLVNFLMGFRGLLPDYVVDYCHLVLRSWGSKDITIPTSILSNAFMIEEGLTSYLSDENITLRSTQNFLQGMFNYLSSLKAVCCSTYTYHIWKRLNPTSTLKIDHLEHSDDYVLMIKSKSDKEVNDFRLLHRIMMRFHGFNDSNKKTNTQQQMMEFISLVSMNGHMTYPQIKKTKETGLNVGCTGYRDDMDMAMSRVAESVRIGTPLTASYFMSKVHYINLYLSYSLHEKGYNGFQSIQEAHSQPVELFGIPDVHPLLLFLCKGSPNNYRLMKFGSPSVKKSIRFLFDAKQVVESHKNLQFDLDIDESVRLYHPTYTFDKENKMIRKIRQQLGRSYEEVNEFWEEHKTLNFLKPRSAELFLPWLKNMYFKENFALAYSRNSRANITLRLSGFVATKCLLHTLAFKRENDTEFNIRDVETFTIKDYISSLKDNIEKSEHSDSELDNIKEISLLRCLMNCDSTITSVYSMFKNSRIVETNRQTKETIAALSPTKPNWITIDSEPSSLLQYIFNPDDFIKDKRFVKSLGSLESDKAVLQKNYEKELNKDCDITTIKFVYNDIMNAKQRRVLCMSYSPDVLSIEEYAKRHIEFGTSYGRIYKLYSPGVTESVNPNTGEYYFQKNVEFTKNEFRLLIDDLTLTFAFLKYSIGFADSEIKDVLQQIKQTGPHTNRTITLSTLMSFDIETLIETGFTQQELKCFTFLKSFMYNDDTELRKFMESKYNYRYSYGKFVNTGSSTNYEQCHLRYNDGDAIAILNKVDGRIRLLTQNVKKGDLVSLFFISLKVFNIITLRVMEKNIHNTSIREFLKSEYVEKFVNTADEDIVNSYNIKGCYKSFLDGFHFDDNDFLDKPAICFVCESLPFPKSPMELSSISKIIDIDIERASVYFGKLKVFTLPFLACRQSNLSYTDAPVNCNGFELNWWLQSNRIRDFIHGRSMSVTKQDFRHITGFEIKEANYSFKRKMNYIHEKMQLIPRFDKSEKVNVEEFNVTDILSISDVCDQPEVEEQPTLDKAKCESSKAALEMINAQARSNAEKYQSEMQMQKDRIARIDTIFNDIGLDISNLYKDRVDCLTSDNIEKFENSKKRMKNILSSKIEEDKYVPPFKYSDNKSEKEYGKFREFFLTQVYETKRKFEAAGYIEKIPPEELHFEIVGYLLGKLDQAFPNLITEEEDQTPLFIKYEENYNLLKDLINELQFIEKSESRAVESRYEITSKSGEIYKFEVDDAGLITIENKPGHTFFLSDATSGIMEYLKAITEYSTTIKGLENIQGCTTDDINRRMEIMSSELKVEFELIEEDETGSEFEGEYEEEMVIYQSSTSGDEKLELIKEDEVDEFDDEKRELDWKQFQLTTAKLQRFELYYNKVDPSSILRLKSQGDPTKFVIDEHFINPRLVKNIRPHEKIVLLRQLKLLFDKQDLLSDVEKYMATSVTTVLLEDIFKYREIEVSEDVYIIPNLHGFNMFLKIENFNDHALIKHVMANTFLIDYKLIDLSKDQLSESFLMGKTIHILLKDHIYERIIDTERPFKVIHNLTEMKIINDAFKRLYDSKFNKYHRIRELLGVSFSM